MKLKKYYDDNSIPIPRSTIYKRKRRYLAKACIQRLSNTDNSIKLNSISINPTSCQF